MTGPASAILNQAPVAGSQPWARAQLDLDGWMRLVAALPLENDLALLGLWADAQRVHALFQDDCDGLIWPASLAVPDGTYPALSPARPSAALFERMIQDLWGHRALEGRDLRPWLDHGRFPLSAPLAARPGAAVKQDGFPFLPVEGEDGHQLAVGPIHAGIIQAGGFRFHAVGERIVRLECRHGYTHKGILALMQGQSPRAAARFACRLAGDAAVAHAIAFAQAAEAAAAITPPPRALHLRAAMAEIERLANHLADIGALVSDAGFEWPGTRTGWHREQLLQAAQVAFGHRLMMDHVVPGGVAQDLSVNGSDAILTACDRLAREWPRLTELLAGHSGLQDRLHGTGLVSLEWAQRLGAGGLVGRASGRPFDARKLPGYAPYPALEFEVPVQDGGDVAARFEQRIEEIPHTLNLIDQILVSLPSGPVAGPYPSGASLAGEGYGVAESFRGDCWCWLDIRGGLIASAFMRDPSWLHWPLLEGAMQNGMVGDFPLVNKSFNASYAGIDL